MANEVRILPAAEPRVETGFMTREELMLRAQCGCNHVGAKACAATDPRPDTRHGKPWYCTRAAGHDGPHVACGGHGHHSMHIWPSV